MTTAVIAFSGGLDTSFLVPFCKEKYGIDKVMTCTVNTGGFNEEDAKEIAARSKEVGADKHVFVDASEDFYQHIIKYLIYGNIRREGYPLSVSAERPVVAKVALDICHQEGADFFINGSTGAGNDQYRFDVAALVLGHGKVKSLSPVREFDITREFSSNYLKEHGIPMSEKKTIYSYNVGLWGVSIGGGETHKADGLIPDDAWYSQPDPTAKETVLELSFEQGVPTKLICDDQTVTGPVQIIQALTDVGNKFGYGRHYYLSTTTPGKKGRIAFESPAADLIYEAHKYLEAIVMTQYQITGKKQIAETFGMLLHEAKMYDPYMDDMMAFLESSQKRISGTAKIYLTQWMIKAVTVTSPYDMLSADGAVYGETSTAYTGADAAGSALIHGFEQSLYHKLSKDQKSVFMGAAS